jgi:dGTPase
MRSHGGFEHNRQSLRIVEELEEKYPGFRGLNLTWEVREGLLKHQTSYDQPGARKAFPNKSPSLEAQIANLADELIYGSHDLDDGLEEGLLSETELMQEVRVFAEAATTVHREYGDLSREVRRNAIIRAIINSQVQDVVQTSTAALRAAGVQTADDVRRHARPLIRYSPARRKSNRELRRYLFRHLYSNPVVAEPNERAGKMLADLFRYFVKHPDEIGESSRQRARHTGWHRAICDYLSGMTDRYTMREHHRLFSSQPDQP